MADPRSAGERWGVRHIDCCCQGQWFTISEFSMESGQLINRKVQFVEKYEGEEKVKGAFTDRSAQLCLVRKGRKKVRLRCLGLCLWRILPK